MDIKLEQIEKAYEGKTVLSGFSATFEEGKTTAIMGMSGSGKTTLLRILMGLEKPDHGTIAGVPEQLFVVFQEDRLCDEFTVEQNLRLVLPKHASTEKLDVCLQELGIADCKKQCVNQLSGGMKRRAAIARALLAADAAAEKQKDFEGLLVLDEPLKGLDEETKLRVMAYIRRMTAKKTTILVTHEKSEAEYLADTVLYLEPQKPKCSI
jgi:NitT/TauT family transport system ATP-binding protein